LSGDLARVGSVYLGEQQLNHESLFIPPASNEVAAMALKLLKRQPAEQLAADALREAILTGAMKPGERLTEVELSEQFGVSRGTVRIALHQLGSDGLVVLTPYTGWSVIDFGPRDLWEIFTLRGSLESVAARLATEQLDAEGAAKLEKAAEELFAAAARSANTADIKRKDFALHRCIVELSNNGRLVNHYRMVEQQVRMFISSTYRPDAPRIVIEHHRPIVEAILRRKPKLAARLCEHHCTSEGELVLSQMPAVEPST
jgi:DNA-binding GntR family transcriptional regulator